MKLSKEKLYPNTTYKIYYNFGELFFLGSIDKMDYYFRIEKDRSGESIVAVIDTRGDYCVYDMKDFKSPYEDLLMAIEKLTD
jgi:hypothetical protein